MSNVFLQTLQKKLTRKNPVIAASEKNCMGYKDRTNDPVDEIVADLVSGKVPGVLLLDPDKVGEVAVKVVQKVAPVRKHFNVLPTTEEIQELAKTCRHCNLCRRACPQDLEISEALTAAAEGNMSKLADLYEACIGCGRCEQACPVNLKIHSYILRAGQRYMTEEKNFCRVGRGAVQDLEIRKVGGPLVLGEIPGILAAVGCENYPKGGKDVYDICREFAKRRYIVVTTGCSAMSAGAYKNEEGKTLYEEFSGGFEAGGVANIGSCVSNSHIAGAAIKVANIFAKRNLRGNYENCRLHPQSYRRSWSRLGCILAESSLNCFRLLELRRPSNRWSAWQQIPTHALGQRRPRRKLV